MGLLSRLLEHDKNKDFWTEALVFTTQSDTLGGTEVSYLEYHFYDLAKKANRYELQNGNIPSPGNIKEETETEMKIFVSYAKMILTFLSHPIFKEKID